MMQAAPNGAYHHMTRHGQPMLILPYVPACTITVFQGMCRSLEGTTMMSYSVLFAANPYRSLYAF